MTLAIEQEGRAVDEGPGEVLDAEGAGILGLVVCRFAFGRQPDQLCVEGAVVGGNGSGLFGGSLVLGHGDGGRNRFGQLGVGKRASAVGHAEAELAEEVFAVGVLLRNGDGQSAAAVMAGTVLGFKSGLVGLAELGADRPAGLVVAVDCSADV